MDFLEINAIHHGRSEILMKQIAPESIDLSFWSPPYFVGKEYEKEETYESWQAMIRQVINHHFTVLKPGAFLVINTGDIRCFRDENIPKFQAMNICMQKSKVTKEMVLEAKEKFINWLITWVVVNKQLIGDLMATTLEVGNTSLKQECILLEDFFKAMDKNVVFTYMIEEFG